MMIQCARTGYNNSLSIVCPSLSIDCSLGMCRLGVEYSQKPMSRIYEYAPSIVPDKRCLVFFPVAGVPIPT